MNIRQTINSQQICESILTEAKNYNIEHCILPSENRIIDRLLARGPELSAAYKELHGKLHQHHKALNIFLELLLNTAAFWNQDKIAEARTARSNLNVINRQIARKAAELAKLLKQRSDLNNASNFRSDTFYNICDVIIAASKENNLFKVYVEKKLDVIRTQFDLKYWPTLASCIQELAFDAEETSTTASDPLTAVATSAIRPSLADFVKALLEAIEEHRVHNYGFLPKDFKITDNTLATLVNCSLDLGPDDLVDGPYIKRFRQRSSEIKKLRSNKSKGW